MNVQEYISSGIVENYVMGLTDEKESAEFERMSETYPEVRAAREAFELSLEEKALMNAVEPPTHLKSKIFSQIEIEAETDSPPVIPLERVPENDLVQKLRLFKYFTAASVVLFVITGVIAFYFARQLADAKQQYQVCLASEKEIQTRLAVLQSERNLLREDLALITNEDMIQVKLPGKNAPASPAPESMATVFWNAKTKAVFLVPNKMPKPASNKQYQLWAMVDGKPQDAGVFDLDSSEPVIPMKNTPVAQAFAISLEDKGPNAIAPSGDIYVMGKI